MPKTWSDEELNEYDRKISEMRMNGITTAEISAALRVSDGFVTLRAKKKGMPTTSVNRPQREIDIEKAIELDQNNVFLCEIAKRANVSHCCLTQRLKSVGYTPKTQQEKRKALKEIEEERKKQREKSDHPPEEETFKGNGYKEYIMPQEEIERRYGKVGEFAQTKPTIYNFDKNDKGENRLDPAWKFDNAVIENDDYELTDELTDDEKIDTLFLELGMFLKTASPKAYAELEKVRCLYDGEL